MERIEQPLTKAQRNELESIVSRWTQLFRAALFVGCVLIIGLLFRSLQHQMLSLPPLWIVPTAALATWLYVRSGRWTGGRQLRRRIRTDLAAGLTSITVIEPASVVEVEELEDEGPSYIVETLDKEAVLLTGQDMARYKRKKFPWSKFGVIEAPQSKFFFGLKRMGDPMPVDRVIAPFTYNQAKELECFEHNFIVLDERKRRILGETQAAPDAAP